MKPREGKPIDFDFSSLIEREDELLKVQNFFDKLIEKERGILRVVGGGGTGRTRFLSEITKIASEYGFELGFINAEEKSKAQIAATSEKVNLLNFEKKIDKPQIGLDTKGIILIIDNALSMSEEELNFVHSFLKCEIPVKLGVVYSIEPDVVFNIDYFDVELCDTVCINPLSPKGIGMWIQNVLNWNEAPPSFLKWLYKETRGLPKLLQENISCLLKSEFLICDSKNNWTIAGSFDDLYTSSMREDPNKFLKDKTEDSLINDFKKDLKLAYGMGQIWKTWRYWNESLARLKDIIKKQESVPKIENVKLYLWHGRLTNLEGDYEKIITVLDEGLELFRKTIDKEGEAEVFYLKALAVSTQGDLKKVSVLLRESLIIYRSINDNAGIARVLQYLGMVYYYQGEYDRAEMLLTESIEICRKLRDIPGISRSLIRLGMIARGKGDLEQSLKLFYEYIKKSDELDDKEAISIALTNIAEISITQKDYSYARTIYEKSLKLLHEMGYKALIARVLKDLAQLARYEGDYEKANKLFLESLELLEKSGNNTEIMWLYLSMAEMELERQNYTKAKEMYIKGLKIFRDSSQTNWLYVMAVFEGLAEISYSQEEMTRAAKLIGAADKFAKISAKFAAKDDFVQIQMRHRKTQERMNRETFEATWTEGNIMSFEEALDFAIGKSSDKESNDMAERMINYIKANYSRDISLTDMAEHFNMSPCYMSTMFKHYTGENFKDYLNFYRVKKAKEYLQKGKLKMATVAKLVGCNSINTFIRIFKKYEGVPPGQFGMNNKE